jgi:APA family basic amino acid/polyamine antiporter
MPEQELAAQAILEEARLQGGRRVSGHYEKIRPGQAGRMIVNEARAMHAQAIVIPLPARTGGSLFGKTVETVLAERPTRVIIHSDGAAENGGSPHPREAAVAGARTGA